jgi:FAD/FMN-containing dehydrogenase
MGKALQETLRVLAAELGEGAILTAESDCVAYGSDWTRSPGRAGAVVLPRTTPEVSRCLALCAEKGVPVVPSGGRTGLAGGAVASENQLVLSLSRMSRIGPVDVLARTVRVQAGAVTQAVHEACAPSGLTWPIDLASKGSCQIGGNLSTNAGGLHVVRYGMSRRWVTGLQAVLVGGEIIELNPGIEKNNTGYDLIQLLIGSEGTLGVITEATLKLAPVARASELVVFLFALPSLSALPSLFERVREAPFATHSFEFFSEACLRAVEAKLHRASRLRSRAPYYALIEIEGGEGRDAWLSGVLESGGVADGLMAESAEDRHAAWALREGITESLALTSTVRKHDLSLPVRQVVPFIEEVEAHARAKGYQLDLYFFGHYGDGSPHINLLRPSGVEMPRYLADAVRFDEDLFALLKRYGGSISAEHGIGCLKKSWVTFSRTPAELRLMRAIKAAFDPKGLLNPGKILDQA